MEEIVCMVVHGCKLAKELEENIIRGMGGEPELITRSCDEIIKTFLDVKERVMSTTPTAGNAVFSYPQMLYPPPHHEPAPTIDPSLQEWLRSSVTQAMGLFNQTQNLAGRTQFDDMAVDAGATRGGDVHVQVPLMEVSADSSAAAAAGRGGGGGSSSTRQRRSDNARTERVPAPRFGNTEIPPEDGYTWRKYGQKEILNSRFPRSYYRCTHQRLYNCPAKKQVQRLDEDPYTFEIAYRGNHTCHMSSTAPSTVPSTVVTAAAIRTAPPHNVTTQEMTQTMTMQPSWLSMELGGRGSGSGGSHSGGGGSGSNVAGPSSSSVRYDREGDHNQHQYLNVATMADAMFNSGSSSGNSMEFLFHQMEDKWQHEDRKN